MHRYVLILLYILMHRFFFLLNCVQFGFFFVNTAIFHRPYFIFEQGLADNKRHKGLLPNVFRTVQINRWVDKNNVNECYD